MSEKKINNVTPKEAESRAEKLLLGFIATQAERINFGQIILEMTVRNGKIEMIKSKEINQTFALGD